MTSAAGDAVRPAPGPEGPGVDNARWIALRQAVFARLLVAVFALPFGILLRPEVTPHPWPLLWGGAAAVAVVTVVSALGVRWRRGPGAQTALQIAADLALVSWLSAWTGGQGSQFTFFYALVVIAGGLLGRIPGGLAASAAACAAFIGLPWLGAHAGATLVSEPAIKPVLFAAFLATVGGLAGVLGDRMHRTEGDLERTTRELDRVRVDNDVILRHLATGVFTVDEQGGVAYLNPAAEQVLGLSAGDVRGRPVAEALPGRLAPLRDLVLQALEHTRGRARAEVSVRGTGGRLLPLGVSTNVLMHEGGLTGVVAVFQDLTEVREMERRARRNETLAEVGALAAGIAHELRNGLKPIAGSIEYLQRELQPEGETAELMDLIVRESTRLNKFVGDLLSYSRERDLALEPTNLDNHLREFVSTLRHDPRRAPGIEIGYEPCETGTKVAMDREQMRQVWLNLAANALEAMGERGTLTVRWTADEDGLVSVEFDDDGPGIAAEHLPRVREPFFTTKRGGTGLGLAIAQRIVERHGGVLTLESEAGRGTRARVELPGAAVLTAQAA